MLYEQLDVSNSPPRVTWTWSGVYWVAPGAGATRGLLKGISNCNATQQGACWCSAHKQHPGPCRKHILLAPLQQSLVSLEAALR